MTATARVGLLLITLYAQSLPAIGVSRTPRTGGPFCLFQDLAQVASLARGRPLVAWRPALYDTAKAKLSSIFSDGNLNSESRRQLVLAVLKTHHTPEAYGALFDALTDGKSPFAKSLGDLASRGISLRIRIKRSSLPDGFRGTVKWGREWKGSWDRLLRSHPQNLDLVWPTQPPDTIDSVAATLIRLSLYLGEAESAGPRRLVPVGSGPISYAAQINALPERITIRVYRLIKALNDHLGKDYSGELKEAETKRAGPVRLALGYLWQTFFPHYDPLAKFHPSKEGYARWLKSPESYKATSYANRAVLKFYSAWMASVMKAMAMVGTLYGSYPLYQLFHDTPVRAFAETAAAVQTMAADPAKVQAANRNYKANEAGNSVVLEYYNTKINALEARGALAEEIEFLKKQRDYFKN